MAPDNETKHTQQPEHSGFWSKGLAQRLQIVAITIGILGSIVVVLTWTDNTVSDWFNSAIDRRIEQHINNLPSRLEFDFLVKNQSDGVAKSAPACPRGWNQMGVFRISHTGASNGQGGQVRVCMRVKPKDEQN